MGFSQGIFGICSAALRVSIDGFYIGRIDDQFRQKAFQIIRNGLL